MRRYPKSLRFFLFTAIVFVLQLLPLIGMFLLILRAPFWSIFLVNAGMIGTGIEAVTGRVSRWWGLLPATFYLGFLGFAAADHFSLEQLDAEYDAANAKVSVDFDPKRQSLLFEGEPDGARHFVRRYRQDVAYWRYPKDRPRYGSNRPPERDDCTAVKGMGTRFCQVERGESPSTPVVIVTQREEKVRAGSLPVLRVTTTITTPDGRRSAIIGGSAWPLRWLPMPVIGVALDSRSSAWECVAQSAWGGVLGPVRAQTERASR